MASRPYFRHSGEDLTTIFKTCDGDIAVLKALRNELAYRKTRSINVLRTKVDDLLAELEKSASTEHIPEGMHNEQEDESLGSSDPAEVEMSMPKTINETIDIAPDEDESESENPPSGEVLGSVASPRGRIGSIRPCGVVAGVPGRWASPVKRDFEIDAARGAPRIVKFVAALRALVKDMKRQGAGMRTVTLDHGEAVALDGREYGYRFNFDGDAELFEGAKVTIALGSRNCDGRIVSVFPQELIVSFDEDLGSIIGTCVLRIDNTAMIDALADRMEKVRNGDATLNQQLADNVLDNSGPQLPVTIITTRPKSVNDRNLNQRKFVEHAIANPVTYLWGPPGTGKTESLSNITEILFNENKRILICSNTNQAVDQVLLKLYKKLGKLHPAFQNGRVLRIGKTGNFSDEESNYLTLTGIVSRKSEGLQKQKVQLEQEVNRIRLSVDSARAILEEFKKLDLAHNELTDWTNQREALEKSAIGYVARQKDLSKSVSKLERELVERLQASGLRRLLMRSEAGIRTELATVNKQMESANEKLKHCRLALDDPKQQDLYEAVASRREHLINILSTHDRSTSQRLVDDEEKKVAPFISEVAAINKTLENIEKAVAAEATIIGATVTKTYLSPDLLGRFDVVIIDEASMVILPAIYYVSGLSKEKVIVSGDFRQLSPIVPTHQVAILELIGNDVFDTAGISKDVITGKAKDQSGFVSKRTIMLSEQYRMKDEICDLINDKMYRGDLLTHHPLQPAPSTPPFPFDGELTVVDTSPIQPFVNRHGTSRYNLMNALAVRNLVRHFREQGFLVDGSVGSGLESRQDHESPLGVCTPFAAQRDVLKKLIEGSDVVVGTVHRYQGDEKSVMIIDIPDSLGERYVSLFAQAGHPEDAGAKLFNVAVSRAKHHVIFVANLNYLDAKLPADAFLRELLYKASNKGRVVDVRDVLAMWPIAEDLKRVGRPFSIDQDALRSGLFRQTDFETVCGADIEQAKKSVAIYSGFVTPHRVAAFEPLLRRKLIEGVKIRCITRPPKRNGSIPSELGRDALNGLEAMGCVVDTRWDIHEKVVIIDDEIIWFGSLNPLSHTNQTDEMMARIIGKPAALQLAAFLSIGSRIDPDKADGLSVAGENPRCPECSHRSTYRTGSYGPFWQCEDECGWKRSIGKMGGSSPSDSGSESFPAEGPPCPKCAAKTVIRYGAHGRFYGCSKYPACTGTTKTSTPRTRKPRGSQKVSSKRAK